MDVADKEQLAILKQGAKVWNKWRDDNPDEGVDLREANLGLANLSWANLSKADLSKADLSRADLGDANLGNANLGNANISLADLCKADVCKLAELPLDVGCAEIQRYRSVNRAYRRRNNPTRCDHGKKTERPKIRRCPNT